MYRNVLLTTHNLQRTIVLILAAVVLCVLVLTTLATMVVARSTVLDELEQRSLQAVERLQNALVLPLWGYDIETASGFMRAEMSNPELLAIAVHETEQENGFWLGYIRERGTLERTRNAADLQRHASSAYLKSTGIIAYNGSRIGIVEVYFSNQGVRREINSRILTGFIITLLVGTAAIVTVGLLLSRRIVQPIRRLAVRLEAVGAGNYSSQNAPSGNDEIALLWQAFEEMVRTVARRQADLQKAISEKEVLLKEVHHRVKNNFQILASLLSLQTHSLPDEAVTALQDSHNRIRSMALVHEKLYDSSSLEQINIESYIQELCQMLTESYGASHINLKVKAENTPIELDTAIPLGLILNEAVSNALLHAFARPKHAQVCWIMVAFSRSQNLGTLTITDNGSGLPNRIDPITAESLGFRLIYLLTQQIDGNCTIHSPEAGGTQISLEFPLDGIE